jgi:hypothetical protein
MASELRVNTLKDASGNNSVATSVIANGSEKAWVNFNGEGTIAIRDSHNTASLTDSGTGVYAYNLTSNMATANYCRLVAAGDSGNRRVSDTGAATSNTTSLGTVIHQNIGDASLADGGDNNGAMLGDLA